MKHGLVKFLVLGCLFLFFACSGENASASMDGEEMSSLSSSSENAGSDSQKDDEGERPFQQ